MALPNRGKTVRLPVIEMIKKYFHKAEATNQLK